MGRKTARSRRVGGGSGREGPDDCPCAGGEGRKNFRWMDGLNGDERAPPATADKPAQRMRFEGEISVFFSFDRGVHPKGDHNSLRSAAYWRRSVWSTSALALMKTY